MYIELLESCNDTLLEHHSILLTSNKEAERAFITCENGLFDNYVVINPLNEPNRLSLIIIKALALMSEHRSKEVKKLLAQGGESLVACIEKGAKLRKNLQKNIETCGRIIIDEYQKENANSDDSNKLTTDVEAVINTLSEQVNDDFIELSSELQQVKSLNEQAIATADNQNSKTKRKLEQKAKALLLEKVEEIEPTIAESARYKLLVADNSLLSSKIIFGIFNKSNFDVTTAQSGEEVIEKYTLIEPNIIILECKFPDIDGIEVIKRIRGMGSTTPIMTSDKNKSLINKFVPFGIGAYISKPFTEEIILDTVLH